MKDRPVPPIAPPMSGGEDDGCDTRRHVGPGNLDTPAAGLQRAASAKAGDWGDCEDFVLAKRDALLSREET